MNREEENRKESEDRNRKGKRAMTVEELEEEEERKEKQRREDEMLVMIHDIETTDLSGLISRLLPKISTKDDEGFTWAEPWLHGISLWEREQSYPARLNTRNPIPKPLFQEHYPHCIPYALYHLLTFQAYIISKLQKKRFFKISFRDILKKFTALTDKTVTEFIPTLEEVGIHKHTDFGKKYAKPMFSLTWHMGFTAEGVSRSELAAKIGRAIKLYGGVLIEKYELKEGKRQDVVGEDGSLELGHIVFCYGWRRLGNDRYEFDCLDSAVEGGYTIEVDMDTFFHVYVIQLDDWKEGSSSQGSRK